LTEDLAEFAKELGLNYDPRTHNPRYNICPTQSVAVVLNDGSNAITTARWGIESSWGGLLTNARAEGIETKKSFRNLLTKQRALILTDGFFEWQNRPGNKLKVPWYFRLKTRKVFAFAGIWENEGKAEPTVCIITTSPNEIVAPVHTRMPVVLARKFYETWLSMDGQPVEKLLACLVAYPAEEMESHVVSTIVNSAKNEGPECIKEVAA